MRKFTNWDRFKDNKSICEGLGCDEDARWFCCPDLDGSLCKPKANLLNKLGVKEEELDENLIDIENIKDIKTRMGIGGWERE